MIDRLYARFLDLVHRRPLRVLAVAAALTALAVLAARGIALRTDFRELLSADTPSLRDLARIEERVGGTGTLSVVVEGPERAVNARFVRDLAAALRDLPPEDVRWIDADVRSERDFFERHKLLYADLEDLTRFRDELRARIDAERRRHDPLDLGLEPARSAPPLDLDAYRRKYEEKVRKWDRDPEGFHASADGKLFVLYVRLTGASTSIERTRAVLARVQKAVARLEPARYHPALEVRYGGDVMTAVEEYESTKEDLFLVSGVCIGLELLVIVLFFLNLRSIVALGVPVLMGTAWTFGVTALAIGYLNASTMFLASIVVGNGVNFGIVLLARYFEERRAGRDVRAALGAATRHTARATLVAALAAGVAYASLLATSFRGFNQFGFIGGVGMVLCWLATFFVLPAVVVVTERLRPLRAGAPRRGFFTSRLAAWVTRRPRAVFAAGLATFLVAGLVGARFLAHDPFVYDFRQLRNAESRDRGAGALNLRVDEAVASMRVQPNGMVLLLDRAEQAQALAAALDVVRAASPSPAIGEVVTIASLLPRDQERKLPVLRDIRGLLSKNTFKWLSPERRAEVRRFTPPSDLRALGVADLPEKLARPFTTADAARGLLVYVGFPPGMSHWDGRDLLRFSAALREIRLPGGEVVRGSGHPVIFSDMLQSVLRDGPRAAALAVLGVVALVVLAFRRVAPVAMTVGALGCGVVWLVGAMGGWEFLVGALRDAGFAPSDALAGAIPKLNFLNFIVLPLTIGIGVDYAVNIVVRYREEGVGSMRKVIESTGGAVILCSLTTVIGYSSLLLSANQALASFGKLANLGEMACLGAALAVLPAAVIVVEGWRARRGRGRAAASAHENERLRVHR